MASIRTCGVVVACLGSLITQIYAGDFDKGRQLMWENKYEEALKELEDLDANTHKEGIAILFYRGCIYHTLLNKEKAIENLQEILWRKEESPKRYWYLANRMLADITPLKTDSLDEISRLIKDNGRRLDIGQGEEYTTKQQQTIIDKLDKIIEQAEEQQEQQQQQERQRQQQQSQGGKKGGKDLGNGGQPSDESRAGGDKGDGNADIKGVGDGGGWGNLPPKKRQDVLQKIGQGLPTHYREVIEAYFRKMAQNKR